MQGHDPVPEFDLYHELEVDQSASTETIGAAYRSLARRHHPDLNSHLADERMRRLNIAHEWLSDPIRRDRYDRARGRSSRAPWSGQDEPAAASAEDVEAETRAPAPPDAERVEGAAPPITAIGVLRYSAFCAVAVAASYLGSVLLSLTGIMDAWITLLGVLLGPDGAVAVAGNIVFSVIVGYLVARASLGLVPTRDGGVRRPLWIIGILATLGFTFGFPLFMAAYLTDLAAWLTGQQTLLGVAVVGLIEAAFVGVIVLVAALVDRDRYGRYVIP